MRYLLLLVMSVLALPAHAQSVTSDAPDKVSVSIYRAPSRDAKAQLQLGWLQGYALVTEQRTVRIPAGRAVIRFEGVAGGILPESAILTGLPDGVREKNLDADLLSPRSLYERSLGRPVTIRRRQGDKVTEVPAIIRSGADGAAIFETREGFVTADCGGRDAIVYDSVPAGLSPRPTLSVETMSPREGQVTLTLSYLAWGFDWQANYVATMRPDGRSADLFAWVTLASGDITSFADADTMVVAGRVQREGNQEGPGWGGSPLTFQCAFEDASEDSIVAEDIGAFPGAPPPPPPPAPMMAMAVKRDEIVVTGFRATQEDLGDLKLYRLPVRTTVASMSQKQVAMLDRPSVPVDVIYRTRIWDGAIADEGAGTVRMLIRTQNRKDKGLGLPLPQGPVAVFEPLGDRRLLAGEGAIGDKAVNEEVEVELATATQVAAELVAPPGGQGGGDYILTVTNALPHAVRYEAEIGLSGSRRVVRPSTRLGRKNGRPIWAVTIPANGTATLRYRLRDS